LAWKVGPIFIPSFHHWRFPHGDFGEDGVPHAEQTLPRKYCKPAALIEHGITCHVSDYMEHSKIALHRGV
jgi:hypothetical protein